MAAIVFLNNKDIPRIGLQLIFMFAVSDGYSFVTIVSILCTFFNLLFSFFNKRNLRGLIKQEEAKEAKNAEEPKEAKVDHGDGATELTIATAPERAVVTPVMSPAAASGETVELGTDTDADAHEIHLAGLTGEEISE